MGLLPHLEVTELQQLLHHLHMEHRLLEEREVGEVTEVLQSPQGLQVLTGHPQLAHLLFNP